MDGHALGPNKIGWKYLIDHPIGQAFLQDRNLGRFIENLLAFTQETDCHGKPAGDQEFRQRSGLSDINHKQAKEIGLYLLKLMPTLSRRTLLKGGLAAAGLAAASGVALHQSGIFSSSKPLQVKGVTYDIGTRYNPGFLTNTEITEKDMDRDMHIIKTQLNCNAVRIFGENLDRLEKCATIAHQHNLQVWFSPVL